MSTYNDCKLKVKNCQIKIRLVTADRNVLKSVIEVIELGKQFHNLGAKNKKLLSHA